MIDKLNNQSFVRALKTHAELFDVELTEEIISGLKEYYETVFSWNAALHLIAPCSPAEFAVRHVLESMVALRFLHEGARVADVGSGAGLPVIPCLIARKDLRATLIEATTKKAVFLREVLKRVVGRDRARVINQRFEEVQTPEADFITCRALERFSEKIPDLVMWSAPAHTLLLFGGESIREAIERLSLPYTDIILPESERRFLFVVKRR